MANKDPYRYFRIEARELVDGLRKGLETLRDDAARRAAMPLLLRHIHTLKGAARVVKLVEVSELAHKFEDVLAPLRNGTVKPTPAQADALRRLLDSIGEALGRIDQPAAAEPEPASQAANAPGPTPAARPGAVSRSVLETVRLQVGEVDSVLAGVVDTAGELDALHRDFASLGGASRQAHMIQALVRRGRMGEVTPEIVARLDVDAGDLAVSLDRARQRALSRIERMERELNRLHEETGRLRMIPCSALWQFLGQAVRDAAQMSRKQVRVEVASRSPRLDAPIFAALQESLLHLVRNSVAHGIEPPAVREQAGKAPEGLVTLRIDHGVGRLRVSCADDGAGVDPESVFRAAEARHGASTVVGTSRDMAGAIALLLRGGVSTAREASELAGRGVGIDAVRSALARVDGKISIASVAGRGTTVSMDLPVSVSSVEALEILSAGMRALLPLEALQRVLRVDASAIKRSGRREELHDSGQALPFVSLHRLLPAGASQVRTRERRITVVILKAGDGLVAVGVDRLGGVSEALVRPLPQLANAAPYISGVSPGTAGIPRLVLETNALAEAVRRAEVEPAGKPPARPFILVVDDSLTTRMLEKSILESAGFAVDLVVSGEDALKRLRERRYDLMLVDVEMPGMDGFTVIEHVRREQQWAKLPIMLVTSRESIEDRQRGKAVGAQDYVVKGDFDQRRVLERIRELIA